MHIPLYGGLKEKKGHNFAIHGDIAPKISKDLPEILAMPCAKCHTNW